MVVSRVTMTDEEILIDTQAKHTGFFSVIKRTRSFSAQSQLLKAGDGAAFFHWKSQSSKSPWLVCQPIEVQVPCVSRELPLIRSQGFPMFHAPVDRSARSVSQVEHLGRWDSGPACVSSVV